MDIFLYNLSLIIAHSLLLESKGQEPLNQAWFLGGGDPPAPTTGESTSEILNATRDNLNPYAATLLKAYQDYGPGFTEVGKKIQGIESKGSQQNDLELLYGNGKWLTDRVLAMQKGVDPELFANRELLGKKQGELYNDVEMLRGVSPTEREEANRYIARSDSESGNSGLGGTSNVLANALRFGQMGRANDAQYIAAKQGVIGTGAAISPALKSGIDTYQLATGKSAGNLAGSQFNAGQAGGQMLSTATAANQQMNDINSQRRDTLDRVTQTMSSLPSYS